MNPKWLKLAGSLLELASREFSNHGCNDWKWPEDWNRADRWAFAEAMVRDNVGNATGILTAENKEEIEHMAGRQYGPPDWWVMAFLASWLTSPPATAAEPPKA